jgi:hypothetical protein
MPRGALIGLYWKVIGWLLLLALAFSVYVALCTALAISLSGVPANQFFGPHMSARNIPFLVLVGIGYLGFALAINVVMRVYLLRDMWVRVLASTHVHGIEAAANVSAKGDLASALGEGIADGLDVAGF